MLTSAVFITCAVTGSGDSVKKNANVPVTPKQIAASALEAHAAGAAIVHLHARDPAWGAPSRDPGLFREVFERIRSKDSEVIINLTGGMGGDLVLGPDDAPLNYGTGTDFVGPRERIAHIIELLPEIASLDCGSLNFDEALYGTTPRYLRYMAQEYRRRRIRPEIEVFELGHIELARQLIAEGVIDEPALFQLCLGIKYGAPATTEAMKAMRDALPHGVHWSAFGVGRMQMPMVAQTVLLGGNVRVGLEDNLYLEKGVPATNAQLVERAVAIVELLGAQVQSATEARQRLGLAATPSKEITPSSSVAARTMKSATSESAPELKPRGIEMAASTVIRRARVDAKKGKAPSTQAGEFVREEIEYIREGIHGARNTRQAIAIGLSKARRAGVKLPPPKKGIVSTKVRRQAERDSARGAARKSMRPSRTRSRAVLRALQHESHSSASRSQLSRQAKASARRRGLQARRRSALTAAKTKGRKGVRRAAKKGAETRKFRRGG